MIVKQFRCNEFSENCYVAYDRETLDAVIVDPGMRYPQEWELVKGFISDNKLKVRHILLTHYHIDHIFGTELCRKEYGVEVSGSLEDMLGLPAPMQQAQMFGFEEMAGVAPVKINLNEGDSIEFGNQKLTVIDCPGHSHHGLCYYNEAAKKVFTGDVLFFGSIGRSDFGEAMGGNGERLKEGIRSKLLTLPKEVVVYSGHGPSTTIHNEKKYNIYLY